MNTSKNQGLYDKSFEHDSCGVGFVANYDGRVEYTIVQKGLSVLKNLSHRGAKGADSKTGDGAGIMIQIPHRFFCQKNPKLSSLQGNYGVGMSFLPKDLKDLSKCKKLITDKIQMLGFGFLGFRDVPVNAGAISDFARENQPEIVQFFVERRGNKDTTQDEFERALYLLRRAIEKSALKHGFSQNQFYIASLSAKTIVYKGLLTSEQIEQFYPDLSEESVESCFAIVHQRYSTNTFPTWNLAQPFRYLAHNGEINTLKTNINKMNQSEANFASELFGDRISSLFPIIQEQQSDSGALDNAVELFHKTGRGIAHTMMMLIPQAWGQVYDLGADLKGFYQYHAGIMEPWDGPASIVFTDGNFLGAMLDRNGLRPSRYTITKDNFIVLSSEAGTLDINPEDVKSKGQLSPGNMLLVDFKNKRIKFDREIKNYIARRTPYRRWVAENRIFLHGFFDSVAPNAIDEDKLLGKLRHFGYTLEELNQIIKPMAELGVEPTGSMGYDASLAVLSKKPQLLYNYFKQVFAQVTNPAIDPIRERVVMSLLSFIGKRGNLLSETPDHAHLLEMAHPILTDEDLQRIKKSNLKSFSSYQIPVSFRRGVGRAGTGLAAGLDWLTCQIEVALKKRKTVVILSDKKIGEEEFPIPMLLATAHVANHLKKLKKSNEISIIVETGEAREVMHFALLLAYGARAINPYLVLNAVVNLSNNNQIEKSPTVAMTNYIQAINKGLLKVMSKMGISTIRSYKTSMLFEAVGLDKQLINNSFEGTISRIGGIGLGEVEKEVISRFANAKKQSFADKKLLITGGDYRFRKDQERHLWTPDSLSTFQYAVRNNNKSAYDKFARQINYQHESLSTLRGLFRIKYAKHPIDIDRVESADSIVKRFVAGAMSFGSISRVAHEAIAKALNSIGCRSNSGEGGEDRQRYYKDGGKLCSATKQIASGRFGVTGEYLVNAKEIQIKIAQGAKPGEGGQLPGHKVNNTIAKVRYSTPGVTLISPPPHHDIYSIEDLSQLIYDLKAINPSARVSVKLVSELGVGTVAAGVTKANADMILISGFDGGTGASPLSSIRHAGMPWEIGLAETNQTLKQNNLRDQVILQVDGQIKTGRDVIVGALLGASEFGFATTLLVCLGCVMMRACHTNCCPVGVATGDRELEKFFTGKAQYIVNYLYFVANEVREYLAKMGVRTLEGIVGKSWLLSKDEAIDFWKANNLDLSKIFYSQGKTQQQTTPKCNKPNFDTPLDEEILKIVEPNIQKREKIEIAFPIQNTNRAVGARLSYHIAKRYGYEGLDEDTITINFEGCAGQSFGAFLSKGVSLFLKGEANDYVGKGLSGGKIVVFPDEKSSFDVSLQSIGGNVILYGATSGTAYFCGRVGERFCIRNSGAVAVAEGVGDHACEYMTGGTVVVLGSFGGNFAAGMSGGIAYIYDQENIADKKCNLQMVDLEVLQQREDIAHLKAIITDYSRATASVKAKYILDNWESSLPLFVKVFPMEYKKILGKMSKEDMQIERLEIND